MKAAQIYRALQDFDGIGAACRDAAKAGFLEWAMGLPNSGSAARAAQDALLHIEALPDDAQAAQLFVAHLRAASHDLPTPVRRGGAKARRRVLH